MKLRLPARSALLFFTFLSFILVGTSVSLAATPLNAPYASYTYDFWAKMVPAPQAYLPDKVFEGSALGVGPLKDPQDLFVGPDQKVYLADTGNNRIICMDSDFTVLRVIDGFTNGTSLDRFSKPEGIFVTDVGEIYVADTGKARIVILDLDGNLIRIMGPPKASDDVEALLPANFVYKPRKVAVSPVKDVYVIAQDIYEGFAQFNVDGDFVGFMGAPRVTPSAYDIFWSRFATAEQKARRALFLPIEFANLDIDEKGLVMAVEQGVGKATSIKRLNPSGVDVLVRSGFQKPQGDIVEGSSISVFADIAARSEGLYSVLDRQLGRVYTYDATGDLLYVFGGIGDVDGLFRRPVALDSIGDEMIVLDADGRFTVFEPTDYANQIHAALRLYNRGKYDEAAEMWGEILKLNTNYDIAYTGIGRALLRKGEYEEAMTMLRLGQNRGDYSTAYALHRQDVISDNFGIFMSVLVILVVGLWVLSRTKPFAWLRRRNSPAGATAAGYMETSASLGYAYDLPDAEKGGFMARMRATGSALRYSLHVITHPIEGFWDLKHEKRGNATAATVILFLVVATYIFMRQYTGFIFNTSDLTRLNAVVETLSVVVPFALWCIVNWALTTLMEGKGTMRDVFIASAYALVPIILINVPLTVISNFLRAEEGGLYYLLLSGGVVWAAVLFFLGTLVTHDYSFFKTLVTTVLIIAGIGVVLFIMLLFSTVINHMIVFIIDLYSEAVFR